MQGIPKQGEIYKHFKDKLYQIIAVATHTETGEKMVVYQALYGDFKIYVRPYEMFISEVDKEKYPEVQQKFRFELWRSQEGNSVTAKIEENHNRNNVENSSEDTTGNGTKTNAVKSNDNNAENRTENGIVKTAENSEENNAKESKVNSVESNSTNRAENNATVDLHAEPDNIHNSGAEEVNVILLQFLDAQSYSKKLEVLTSNMKHLNDRLVNDMAVALDCTVDDGPLDIRIQGLINCLQAMRRFEDRRLR